MTYMILRKISALSILTFFIASARLAYGYIISDQLNNKEVICGNYRFRIEVNRQNLLPVTLIFSNPIEILNRTVQLNLLTKDNQCVITGNSSLGHIRLLYQFENGRVTDFSIGILAIGKPPIANQRCQFAPKRPADSNCEEPEGRIPRLQEDTLAAAAPFVVPAAAEVQARIPSEEEDSSSDSSSSRQDDLSPSDVREKNVRDIHIDLSSDLQKKINKICDAKDLSTKQKVFLTVDALMQFDPNSVAQLLKEKGYPPQNVKKIRRVLFHWREGIDFIRKNIDTQSEIDILNHFKNLGNDASKIYKLFNFAGVPNGGKDWTLDELRTLTIQSYLDRLKPLIEVMEDNFLFHPINEPRLSPGLLIKKTLNNLKDLRNKRILSLKDYNYYRNLLDKPSLILLYIFREIKYPDVLNRKKLEESFALEPYIGETEKTKNSK